MGLRERLRQPTLKLGKTLDNRSQVQLPLGTETAVERALPYAGAGG